MLDTLIHSLLAGTAGTLAVAGALTAFGTRRAPAPLAAVNAAFEGADWTRLGPLPPLETMAVRDDTELAWRSWPAPDATHTVVLIHGSTADSRSVHALATTLSQRGITCHAPDMRGHGRSGRRGDIDYIGQLEDDVADLVNHLRAHDRIAGPLLLLGHSSGGGFGLRMAASRYGRLFDGYVLAAPMIHHAPPLSRPRVGGWAVPFIPRIVGLTILHHFGLRFWEHLPVIAFATPLNDTSRTSRYSFRLQVNFRPHMQWRRDVSKVCRPLQILIGANDELFDGSAYPRCIDGLNPQVGVQLIDDMAHADWYVRPEAFDALESAVKAR